MRLDISNTNLYADDISGKAEALETYRKELERVSNESDYTAPEASLLLPFDESVFKSSRVAYEEKSTENLTHIFMVGMGGPGMSSRVLYESMHGYEDLLKSKQHPLMVSARTVDSHDMQAMKTLIREEISTLDQIIIIVSTQSGTTTETLANAEILIEVLRDKFGEAAHDRVVVITNNNSELHGIAMGKNITTASINPIIGGRYMAFSEGGILPLLFAGIDVESYIAGGRDARNVCLSSSISENIAIQSAACIKILSEKGKSIHTSFYFSPRLELLGKWYRQLTAESLGKEKDLDGNTVHSGVTPEVAIGSIDLHSTAQMYLGGPQDKMFSFIEVANRETEHVIPNDARLLGGVNKMINGKKLSDTMDAIINGTRGAFQEHSLPYMDIFLDEVSPYEIGYFMQFKMMETMYLGRLLNVNPFDQPSVESYKVVTRKLLDK